MMNTQNVDQDTDDLYGTAERDREVFGEDPMPDRSAPKESGSLVTSLLEECVSWSKEGGKMVWTCKFCQYSQASTMFRIK